MTNNVKDFVPIAVQALTDGEGNYGLLLTSDLSLPRSRDRIGRLSQVLGLLLKAEPEEDCLRNRIRWLAAVSGLRAPDIINR